MMIANELSTGQFHLKIPRRPRGDGSRARTIERLAISIQQAMTSGRWIPVMSASTTTCSTSRTIGWCSAARKK
ncbi:MAG: hypothetical protein Q8R69_04235 [Telluria sp.]|nr:hypothetical protein [Telluria sp.]